MKKLTLTAIAIGLGAANTYSAANLVVNGDFQVVVPGSGSYATIAAGNSFGAWKVDSGSVDLIRTYWQGSGGSGQSVDMSGLLRGAITQDITLNPSTTYALSFDMSRNPDGGQLLKTIQVEIGGHSQTFTYNQANTKSSMNWSSRGFTFTTAADVTTTALRFTDISSTGGTAYGAAIDNVVLTAVPEPASIAAVALLLLPVGSGALRLLRKRAAR